MSLLQEMYEKTQEYDADTAMFLKDVKDDVYNAVERLQDGEYKKIDPSVGKKYWAKIVKVYFEADAPDTYLMYDPAMTKSGIIQASVRDLSFTLGEWKKIVTGEKLDSSDKENIKSWVVKLLKMAEKQGLVGERE
jgi:hypothetical protein